MEIKPDRLPAGTKTVFFKEDSSWICTHGQTQSILIELNDGRYWLTYGCLKDFECTKKRITKEVPQAIWDIKYPATFLAFSS